MKQAEDSVLFSTLLEKERKARVEGNHEILLGVFSELLTQCSNDSDILTLLKILSIRRGQDKEALRWLIKEVFQKKKEADFLTSLLSEVIEGKMYLEEERIEITEEIKRIYEKQAENKKALEIILGVPVETFTMIKEPVIIKYQLEQFRLCLVEGDYIRGEITMKKIRKKYFEESGDEESRRVFLEYVVMLNMGQKKYLETAEAYIKLGDAVLASLYCVLSSSQVERRNVEEEKKKMLKMLYEEKRNEEWMREYMKKFIEDGIIEKVSVGGQSVNPSVSQSVNPSVSLPHPQSCSSPQQSTLKGGLAVGHFSLVDFIREKYKIEINQEELHKSINEHNFRVISKFYSKISIKTMSRILQSEEEEVASLVGYMVNNGLSESKMDQKKGMIEYQKGREEEEVGEILERIIEAEHLIYKEKLKGTMSTLIK